MNSDRSPERDWRVFRELQTVALDRFCKRTLDEAEAVMLDRSGSNHERYLAVYSLLQDRNEELARAFDDPRRSRMIQQLMVMHSLHVLKPDDLARFTPQTPATVEGLAEVS